MGKLIDAVKNGALKEVKRVLSTRHYKNNPSFINEEKDKYGYTALHLAIDFTDLGIVKALLEAHADTNVPTNSGQTSAHLAAFNGNILILQALLEKGADFNRCDNNDCTPLHIAVVLDNPRMIQALLKGRATVDIKANNGKTPLEMAKSHIRAHNKALSQETINLLELYLEKKEDNVLANTLENLQKSLFEEVIVEGKEALKEIKALEQKGLLLSNSAKGLRKTQSELPVIYNKEIPLTPTERKLRKTKSEYK